MQVLLGGENPCLDLPSHHVSKKGVGTKLLYILSPPHFILGRGGLGTPNAFITRQKLYSKIACLTLQTMLEFISMKLQDLAFRLPPAYTDGMKHLD